MPLSVGPLTLLTTEFCSIFLLVMTYMHKKASNNLQLRVKGAVSWEIS